MTSERQPQKHVPHTVREDAHEFGMTRASGAGGPVEKHDEESLHGGAEPEGRGRFAVERDVFLRGIDVRDKHRNQQKDQANAGRQVREIVGAEGLRRRGVRECQ